ncbi:MAG TPA: N-acetyltransferase [Candidatus Acidoferrales bacterium]|nr:N-acetyltransferase [Candidatus Acidoferrales bacterium]
MHATLRPYRPDDFDRLFEIDRACYPPGIAYSRRMLRAFLDWPGAECIVAEIESTEVESAEAAASPAAEPAPAIAAFIITESDALRGHILTIDVLDANRRRGLGSALLRRAEQSLFACGVRTIELETATGNKTAVAFWQKHGYRTRGLLKRYYLGRDDAFAMTKRLTKTHSR